MLKNLRKGEVNGPPSNLTDICSVRTWETPRMSRSSSAGEANHDGFYKVRMRDCIGIGKLTAVHGQDLDEIR